MEAFRCHNEALECGVPLLHKTAARPLQSPPVPLGQRPRQQAEATAIQQADGRRTVRDDQQDEGPVAEKAQNGGRVGILLGRDASSRGLGLSWGKLGTLLDDLRQRQKKVNASERLRAFRHGAQKRSLASLSDP